MLKAAELIYPRPLQAPLDLPDLLLSVGQPRGAGKVAKAAFR
jgi:hypothetical protein